MIYLKKSMPAPECLQKESGKVSGNYRCGDVVPRLGQDFHQKCYLCGSKGVTLNVEHLRPHKGDPELKFAWENLFLACGHCNSIKGSKYEQILDCSQVTDIEQRLHFKFNPFPGETVEITAQEEDVATLETQALLTEVFTGSTELQKLEANNLTAMLNKELVNLLLLLQDYFDPSCATDDKERLRMKIRAQLSDRSSFTAFKRAFVRQNKRMRTEFAQEL